MDKRRNPRTGREAGAVGDRTLHAHCAACGAVCQARFRYCRRCYAYDQVSYHLGELMRWLMEAKR